MGRERGRQEITNQQAIEDSLFYYYGRLFGRHFKEQCALQNYPMLARLWMDFCQLEVIYRHSSRAYYPVKQTG